MARQHAQSQPTWAAVKAKLASLDRLALIGLIQDLYAADRGNQVFLHARFGLGEDVLKPYKEALDRWLWPDVLRSQDTSVAKAKQTISSYRKAVGAPAGLAELMVYYCETAAGFSSDIGLQDEDFFDALVRMFEQALKATLELPPCDRDAMIIRLDRVRTSSHNLGYGVGDDMDFLLAKYTRKRRTVNEHFSQCHNVPRNLAKPPRNLDIGRTSLRYPEREESIMSSTPTEFHKIWIDQCEATEGIRENFGSLKALDYLIGEKLCSLLMAAESDALFFAEVPAFVAEIRRLFTAEEIHDYLNYLERTK
jgi:hypothetical protein